MGRNVGEEVLLPQRLLLILILYKMENTISIQMFSNAEILTCNALDKLDVSKLNPQTFKLINAVVYNVCEQLENSEQLKKHSIKIN